MIPPQILSDKQLKQQTVASNLRFDTSSTVSDKENQQNQQALIPVVTGRIFRSAASPASDP
jgi:hypothetical protein